MAYKDGEPVAGSVTLEGVWLHDPDDPEGTARNYRFGKAARSGTLEVSQQDTQYAGREYPVTDFGPFTTERVDVRVDVPFGPAWAGDLAGLRAFVTARKAVMFRDNRGRALSPAVLSGLREQDVETGTQVTFQASRSDG